MAKIKARGDSERARWRDASGAELILTSKGRLLQKMVRGGSLTLAANLAGYSDRGFDEAAKRAAARGMERV